MGVLITLTLGPPIVSVADIGLFTFGKRICLFPKNKLMIVVSKTQLILLGA